MEEMLRVLVLEDSDSGVERPVEIFIDSLHHEQRYILVRHAFDERVLQHMGERAVADVMQQNSDHCRRLFLLGNGHILEPQRPNGLLHQVHCAERMPEAAVHCTRVHQVRQT